MYKKTPVFLFAAILFFGAVSFVRAQPKDLIVIVDTSTAMSQHYASVTGYLTGAFLRENLALGDTFHLISFAGKPRFELARRIIDEGDVRTINGRIFLLYPLEPVSDLQAAVSYGERYLSVIPQGRQKKVFVVGAGDGESVVNASAARLPAGAEIRYLKVPLAGGARPPSSASSARPQTPAGQAASSGSSARPQTPAASAPPSSQQTAGSPAGQAVSSGSSARPQTPAAASPTAPASAPPSGQQTPAPGSVPPESPAASSPETPASPPPPVTDGSAPLTAEPVSEQEVPPPAVRSPAFSYSGSVPLPALIGGGILLLALIGLAIVLTIRRLGSSPNKVMAAANAVPGSDSVRNGADLLNSFARTKPPASQAVKTRLYHRDNPNQFLSNPPLLSLFVEDQNTAIGRRNVHALKAGSRFTVGGGVSDYLVFLVPLPKAVGELRFDGKSCTFYPLKSRYFPDIGSNPVTECIGKTIRIVSDKKYEVFFHFERFNDPLIELNKLLHSIKVPEK